MSYKLYLFIFQSIGTQELILIGIIALIFLGPRKLPEYARKIGKVMSDLRNTTNEFKTTWQREVNFEEETKALKMEAILAEETPETAKTPVARENKILGQPDVSAETSLPEIKSIDPETFAAVRGIAEKPDEDVSAPDEDVSPDLSDKRSWL